MLADRLPVVGRRAPAPIHFEMSMQSLLLPQSRAGLRRRSQALRPETRGRWGRFTAPQMLAHAIQSLRVMNGEVEMPSERVPWVVRNPPLKHLLIYVLPFPKGLPTSPVLLQRRAPDPEAVTEGGWTGELDLFAQLLDAVGDRARQTEWPSHAAFGTLTGREWGVLQYRHLDHHFRQFGI